MGSSVVKFELGSPFPQEMVDRYAETGLPPQGIGADMIAVEYGITREERHALASVMTRLQQNVVRAVEAVTSIPNPTSNPTEQS